MSTPKIENPQIPYMLSNMPDLPKVQSIPWEAIQPMVIAPHPWFASTALETFALRVAEHEDVNIVDGYERHRKGLQIEGSPFIQTVGQHETLTVASNVTAQEQTRIEKDRMISPVIDDTVQEQAGVDKDLPVISPAIDGRLKNLDG